MTAVSAGNIIEGVTMIAMNADNIDVNMAGITETTTTTAIIMVTIMVMATMAMSGMRVDITDVTTTAIIIVTMVAIMTTDIIAVSTLVRTVLICTCTKRHSITKRHDQPGPGIGPV